MSAINNAGLVNHPYPVNDTLFFKIQGDPEAIQLTSKVVKAIVQKHGSSRFEFAATDEEAEDLWQNRKYALMSTMGAEPGSRCWTTDVWYAVHLRHDPQDLTLRPRLLAYLFLACRSLCTRPRKI